MSKTQNKGDVPVVRENRRAKRKAGLKQNLKTRGAKLRQMNAYLQTLVDPEKNRGVRYPDEFVGLTGTLQGLINADMYYFPADAALTPSSEPAGTYLNVVSPTMLHPVLQYAMDEAPAQAGLVLSVGHQDDQSGLFSLQEDASTPATSADQLLLQLNGPVQNVRGEYAWSDQSFTVPTNRAITANGTVMYGVPFTAVPAAGAVNVTLNLTTVDPMPVGTTISLYAVNGAGAITGNTSIPSAMPLNAQSVSLDVSTLLTTLANGNRTAGLPGLGFRVAITNGGLTSQTLFLLSGVSIQVALMPAITVVNRFTALEFPDQGTYTDTIDKYRVVSASAWIEYQGSDLQNGGQHAALYYAGGQSPFEIGLWNYDLVAETPGSYQGGLRYGSYSIWKPSDPRDMLFRALNPRDRWLLPFIVHAGLVSTPAQVDALRLRVPINFEFMSTSQFYNYEKGLPDLLAIEHANVFLREFPMCMENPEHWEAIKSILKKAASAAAGFGEWIVANRGWLVPAATAVAALI